MTVDNLGPCKKLLHVEVEVAAVDACFVEVSRKFQKEAKLPGFRPGKVPIPLLFKNFASKIEAEAKQQLVSEQYRLALSEQNLLAVGPPDIEVSQFGRGQPLLFTATLETAPDFTLPDYKALPVRVTPRVVTEADMDQAFQVLREKHASFLDVDRPARVGDYLVVNYTGSCEGKPITATAPTAQGLTERKAFWVRLGPQSFFPGFTEQIVGAQAGEHRTVTATFPPDFVEPALANKNGVFEVDIVKVKEQVLPPVDDELAKKYQAAGLDALRAGVRRDLQNELNYKLRVEVRNQLVAALLARVTCELPESVVLAETRNVMFDLVKQNRERGISQDAIEEKKDEIFAFATNNAKDRVKASFLLGRIAEKEGLKASPEEVERAVLRMAEENRIKPERLVRQLKENNGLAQIQEQIVTTKVLDFLQLHARIEEAPAGTGAP